jgi:hypothetical protein
MAVDLPCCECPRIGQHGGTGERERDHGPRYCLARQQYPDRVETMARHLFECDDAFARDRARFRSFYEIVTAGSRGASSSRWPGRGFSSRQGCET